MSIVFRSFYLEPVYRLVPIFSPFIMAALLVSSAFLLTQYPDDETTYHKIFKILAPYVILSAALAQLNTKLSMPPFSLFLIALSLTDGACGLVPQISIIGTPLTSQLHLSHDDHVFQASNGYGLLA